MKGVEQRRAAEAKRAASEESAARALAERIAATAIVVKARAGDQGRLYGSVTNADIADAISAQLGETIDKRRIELEEPIRQLGRFQVPIRLHRAVTATLSVEVQAEGGG